MPRSFQIPGECLIKVNGGAFGPFNSPSMREIIDDTLIWQLGLTEGPVNVTLNYHHMEINTDDFGPEVPVELLWMLADAFIDMTLCHFDWRVLDAIMLEAAGGFTGILSPTLVSEGTFAGAGTLMGGGGQPPTTLSANQGTEGNHYITLYIIPGQFATAGADPPPEVSKAITSPPLRLYKFFTCYLVDQQVIPFGTKRSLVKLRWRAIPYQAPFTVSTNENTGEQTKTPAELTSSGYKLWSHQFD